MLELHEREEERDGLLGEWDSTRGNRPSSDGVVEREREK